MKTGPTFFFFKWWGGVNEHLKGFRKEAGTNTLLLCVTMGTLRMSENYEWVGYKETTGMKSKACSNSRKNQEFHKKGNVTLT